MNEATKTTTLAIDGMTGDLCVQRATAALKGVPGVSTVSVAVGQATIEASPAGCDAACAALAGAGFTACWATPALATKKVLPKDAPTAAPVCPSQQAAPVAAAAKPNGAPVATLPNDSTPIELAAAAN